MASSSYQHNGRRKGRGDYSRRDHQWGSHSPRSGSPGMALNGSPHSQRRRDHAMQPQQDLTPHQEYVNYLTREWRFIERSMINDRKKDEGKVTFYTEREQNLAMQNFQPFDLDSFLAQMQQSQQPTQ